MAARCAEGVGSASYAEAFRLGRDRVPDVVRGGYTLNAQTAVSTYDMTGRFRIRLMSALGRRESERFGFSVWREEETDGLFGAAEVDRLLVIPRASHVVPHHVETT